MLCTAELQALKRTDQLLDTLGEVEPRRDLVGLVMRRIEREQETRPVFKRFLISLRERRPQLQTAAVGILAVALLAFGLFHYQPRRPSVTQRSRIVGPQHRRSESASSDVEVGGWPAFGSWIRKIIVLRRPNVLRLSESDVKRINDDMKRAREALRDPRPDGGSTLPDTPEFRRVGSSTGPTVILRAGREGTLVIEPGPEEPTEPAE